MSSWFENCLQSEKLCKEINEKTYRDESFLNNLIEIFVAYLTSNPALNDIQILKCLSLLNYLLVNDQTRIAFYFKSKLDLFHKLTESGYYQSRNAKKIWIAAKKAVQLLSNNNSNETSNERYIIEDGSNFAISHGNGENFSSKGIQIIINRLAELEQKLNLKLKTKIILPAYRSFEFVQDKRKPATKNYEILK